MDKECTNAENEELYTPGCECDTCREYRRHFRIRRRRAIHRNPGREDAQAAAVDLMRESVGLIREMRDELLHKNAVSPPTPPTPATPGEMPKGSNMQSQFEQEIEKLINKYSIEQVSCTQDHVLARYLVACLTAYEQAVVATRRWNS